MNRLRTRRLRPIGALIAGFLVFASLLAASPATAEDQDPSTYAYSIAGTLSQNDEPIPGVKITASLDDFIGEAISDEWGEWEILVPLQGKYKVEIDKTTIPEGFALSSSEGAVGEADLTTTDFAAVLFQFGESTVQEVSFIDQLLSRLFAGVNFGLLLALAAVGISLIYGTTGLNNFAHGEMVTLGAILMWTLYTVLDLNIVVAGLLATLITAASGWAQNAGLWKPLRKRRIGLNQMMIVSIGLGISARYVVLLLVNGEVKAISGDPGIVEIGPILTNPVTLVSMVICAISLGGVALFLTRTRIGKATRAVSDNSSLAASTGIDVEKIIQIVWVFAAGFTGLAGVLYGLQFEANWTVGYDILLLLFAAVTLGGLGTALGATVGALIIGVLVETSTLYLPSELKYSLALAVLILILIFRPQGVLGKKQRIG